MAEHEPDADDAEGRDSQAVASFSLAELSETSGVVIRTIRWYQSEGLLPKPSKHGRDAVYGQEHLERLGLIADLRDRGLTLVAIRDLVARERPSRTVAEWLGIDATLSAPWSDDRPRLMTREELSEVSGARRRGLVAELQDANYIQSSTGGGWLVPSPTLLELALQLHDAGVAVELSGQLRDLLRERLSRAVDDAVKLLVARAGTGFAASTSAEDVGRAIGALRPVARETTSLILAQEVERALRQLAEAGPAGIDRARRR